LVVAQLEEELRQAEEHRADLYSKLSHEMQLQKERDQEIIDELKAKLDSVNSNTQDSKSSLVLDHKKVNLAFALKDHLIKAKTSKFN